MKKYTNKKILIDEKGSITIYVLTTMLLMLIVTISVYVNKQNEVMKSMQEISKIQKEYNTDNIDNAYEEFTSDENPPIAEIAASEVENKISKITVKAKDNETRIAKYEIYVNNNLVNTQETANEEINYDYTTTFGNCETYAVVTDVMGNTVTTNKLTIVDNTIKYLDELKRFRDNVNSGNSYQDTTITQIADIDMGGQANGSWTPIGTDSTKFRGTYDGSNFTISNLYINTTVVDCGLFGNFNGTIKNLTVKNANVTCGGSGAILAGYAVGTIENVKVEGGRLSGIQTIGAIAGYCFEELTIRNCSNSAEVICPAGGYNSTNAWYIGGIAGMITGRIEKCMNTGKVSGVHAIGGILGQSGNTIVKECVNKGAVEAVSENLNGEQAGGIVGYLGWGDTATVDSCYNTGIINSLGEAGGIVAEANGNNGTAIINNSYNIGEIKQSSGYTGGIIGKKNVSGILTLSNNYWLSTCGTKYGFARDESNGNTSSNVNATPKSSQELKNLTATLGASFKADTENINNGYPILTWQ